MVHGRLAGHHGLGLIERLGHQGSLADEEQLPGGHRNVRRGRNHLGARGFVVYLRTSVDQQLSRTRKVRERPLLQNDDPRAVLEERVADNLQDPDNLWFGLSKRALVIVVNTAEGLPAPARYEDLVGEAYRGRVCMRSSSNIYNLSLLASMIESSGAGAAEELARGVVANFARPPQGNDTAQLKAVASGECGVTIANTYYLGRLMGSDDPADRARLRTMAASMPPACRALFDVDLPPDAAWAAAPSELPTMAASLMGVSSTRPAPNSSYSPLVTPKGLPRTPTSQPRMMTVGSRCISSRSGRRLPGFPRRSNRTEEQR